MAVVRILIADDFAPVRQIWKQILSTDARIQVVGECANGQEVMDCIHQLQPDVAILDINMEPVNGFETCRYIATNYPHIKVLGISVHNEPNYARRMLENGARGFIVKSAQKDEMIQAILNIYEGNNFVSAEIAPIH
ncbi:MAG: response regulator transcription factor [Lacibacter sp.]|jgi:DNA-binding NarL/FixJ family response regulator